MPKIFYESVRTVIRGYWPEPVTQQTLAKFLEDINYFEEPKKYTNIGVDPKAYAVKRASTSPQHDQFATSSSQPNEASHDKIDELMNKLSVELESPPLNYDDVRVSGRELGVLAVYAGIYRDLFGNYEPDREYIKFTPEQVERLSLLVPHYWLTDQPKARVEHFPKEPEPTKYFQPIIDVAARFVRKSNTGSDNVEELIGESAYYGNIIAACDAPEKPSITLNGKLLNPNASALKTESNFSNWSSGVVELVNFPENHPHYHTVILLNLDSLHEKSSNVHWMITNIRPSPDGKVIYDEICDYLPVFGIRGFGYSRYVFLVLHHEKSLDVDSNRINEFSLESRKFDATKFMEQNQASGLKPVGLSWFQTTWDISSNRIFHDLLKMKAPIYEHVQTKNVQDGNDTLYPGKRAFNSFLDRTRTKKSINEQVLLERLKNVDPLDYRDQYVPPIVAPTVFEEKDHPSWMYTVNLKKKNRLGYWRGLRPASAILPLDNNADLDYPTRPLESSNKIPAEFPNLWRRIPRRQLLKDMPTNLPPNEHQSAFIQEDHEIHLNKVIKMMEEFQKHEEKK